MGTGRKHKVILRYGPYTSAGVLVDFPDRLAGISAVLSKNGHTVDLEEFSDRNIVQAIVHGEVVFTCRIQDLVFGGDGELDPLCKDVLKAVDEAY